MTTTTEQQAIVSAQIAAREKQELERLAADADRTLSAEIRRVLRRHLADIRSTTTHPGRTRQLAGERWVEEPAGRALLWALRVSEALALTWSQIDFDDATITDPGRKTEASAGTIPLLPALAAELRAHRERQASKSFARIRPDALVFQTASGNRLHRRNVLRAVQIRG
jgi:integrase